MRVHVMLWTVPTILRAQPNATIISVSQVRPTESPNLWFGKCSQRIVTMTLGIWRPKRFEKTCRVADRSHLPFWCGTQNDDTDYCKTGADLAAIQEEGSPAAPMLRAVSTTHHSLMSC